MRRSRVRVPALAPLRGVAQLGSAFGSGPKGRVFESPRPDHEKNVDFDKKSAFFSFIIADDII